jgi:hypothetical protein
MADTSNEKKTISYTNFDFQEIINEISNNLRETNSFKDFNFEGSNISVLMEQMAAIGSQNSYYNQATANEIFQPTAKLYKSLNKIGNTLRYNARGRLSAEVDVVGSLNPEYVFGKIGKYIEIPAYSVFPSDIPTKDGKSFTFTNPKPLVYITRGYGIRELVDSDIRYAGYTLPTTAKANFFDLGGNVIGIDPTKITLPLSLLKPLSIIVKTSTDNYRPFDIDNYPKSDPANNQSVGQPFVRTVNTLEYASPLVPNTVYSLIFNFDISTSTPYMTVEESVNVINDQLDDVICTFRLVPTDNTNTFYRLEVVDMNSYQRFMVGVTGIQNLESCRLEYDTIGGTTNSVERIKLVVNKDGSSPALGVLINGKILTFSSGTIQSQKIPSNYWDSGVEEYNVNLSIGDENSPETNYNAQLIVTSHAPVSNQITIAKINTKYTDGYTGTKTLETTSGNKFGDLKYVVNDSALTTEQKGSRVYFERSTRVQRIVFDKPFVLQPGESPTDYAISITPEGNVRTWHGNKNERSFDLYVEPSTQFEGYISWTATKITRSKTTSVDVSFNTAVPQVTTIDGEVSNYMIQLTPNDNVEVWYENVTENGFTIATEKEFYGKVSWSIYNYYGADSVPTELASAYRQTGKISVSPAQAESGVHINLSYPINDNNYAIQLIPNKNVRVFYANKTSTGFTIKVEPNTDQTVDIDWYIDSNSADYTYQKHGEIDFSGQVSSELQIPGLYFNNIPETFEINGLMQGLISYSFVNANTVVDENNNKLNMSVDPTRLFQNDVRFIINDDTVSTNSVRVFVKNSGGTWDEWDRAGAGYDGDPSPGNKTYYVKVNPDKKTMIEFGDGVIWGESVVDKEIFIFGLVSVGREGNVAKNTLSKNVVLSKYIIGDDNTNINFEKNFVSLVGLKSALYFSGNAPSSRIIDSEKTPLHDGDITIVQNKIAFGGNEIETVDEIRQNITNTFVTQDRNVSLSDYERYIREVFNNYLQTSKVLTYKEIMETGLIPADEQAKYWFNHIFVVGLNKDGSNVISKSLSDAMVTKLDNSTFKMVGAEHVVTAASWIPIDVLIRYKKSKFGSGEQIETEMRKKIQEYFSPDNHTLGETIRSSDIIFLMQIDYVDSVEIMLNKDPNNKFNAADYDINFRQTDVDVDIARRNKIMSLIAKDPSLVKVVQPLFDTLKIDGTREWNYTLDIKLSEFEFPKMGDIIIEREE